ncbi:MAG: corrinoid protein-associated methyltransferase CpaM [Myxococcota bacterium]
MSTYVLMRILESAPRRYELGIALLTLGRVGRAYDRLASHVRKGQRVLDLGCGPGALAVRAARRGASVKAIDVDPAMLEIAAERLRDLDLEARVELVEMGVAELDREPAGRFDAVTSGLCLSELGDDELAYTLGHVARVLAPGGLLLVADEVVPERLAARLLHGLVRAPLAALTYLITQQTTRPIEDLAGKLLAAGFAIESTRSGGLRSFVEVVARKPEAAPR